ncbi:lipoate--protein ligase family protein [Picosynechococcus sp. PCC 73109]|uniref:lipoate--protein ligase family protein n=1 Tax=Picosynechococcus sp. PCC 73109 TaxID=374982 RepID=UPI000B120D75|nr:biotin/lipoate A/B protein ligase family protein [Picosynechococcus sp. PCC 73109]
MAEVWHYIPPIEASGETQMAIDAWLLDQHLQGKIPSVLRFYTWEPVAISLGYHQRKYPDFWNDLTYQGKKIDLVRRPSGGRAVLHQGDLTYAIITSGLKGDRQTNYETLCQFLIAGFGELGIPLSYGHQQRNYGHFDSCFRTHTKADLVTESGYKLIGSAQLRRQGAILQHGSIRLNSDPELYEKVFGEPLIPGLTFVADDIQNMINTLCQQLQLSLNLRLVETDFIPQLAMTDSL